jgi:hypothetical protein
MMAEAAVESGKARSSVPMRGLFHVKLELSVMLITHSPPSSQKMPVCDRRLDPFPNEKRASSPIWRVFTPTAE